MKGRKMQAGALTAAAGRQTIASMVNRATQSQGTSRNFTTREARTTPSLASTRSAATGNSAAPTSDGGAGLKFMRFSLSFDVKSAELFILVRDPSSGKIVFKAPNVARPSPIDEAADKQVAELKAAMAGENDKGNNDATVITDLASELAAVASNSNAPADTSVAANGRIGAGGAEGAVRGQGVNVTA